MFSRRGVTVDIKAEGMTKVDVFLRSELSAKAKRIAISAINGVAAEAKTEAVRRISNESKVKPAKTIKQRVSVVRAHKNRMSAALYFRSSPISAHLLAAPNDPVWTRSMKGAKARKRSFKGTFAARPKRGRNRGTMLIFDRIYGKGVPNEEALVRRLVRLKSYETTLVEVGRIFSAKIPARYVKELKADLAGYRKPRRSAKR